MSRQGDAALPPFAQVPRAILVHRNSSTSFGGDDSGRPRSSGRSLTEAASRRASPSRAAADRRSSLTYAAPPPRHPKACRMGASHGRNASGLIANISFAVAVSPKATSTSRNCTVPPAAGPARPPAAVRPPWAPAVGLRGSLPPQIGGRVAWAPVLPRAGGRHLPPIGPERRGGRAMTRGPQPVVTPAGGPSPPVPRHHPVAA